MACAPAALSWDMPYPTKPYAPSCDRNADPILAVLRQYFADRTHVLEIGSGTGQHAVHFAAALPHLRWQPSDVQENLVGIEMWLDEAQLPNLLPPLDLNVEAAWPQAQYDAAFTANTLHIMSWLDVQRFFAGLSKVLADDAALAVYGPFNYGGRFTSESNRQFDGWLKDCAAHMGIRDFEAVDALASSIGLRLLEDRALPANNRALVWRRDARTL